MSVVRTPNDFMAASLLRQGHYMITATSAASQDDEPGCVGIALRDTRGPAYDQSLFMPVSVAQRLADQLRAAVYGMGGALDVQRRARGAHLWRFIKRSGRVVVQHDDREFWIEPTKLRATARHHRAIYDADGTCRRGEPVDLRACANCQAPLCAGMTAYREVEPPKNDWKARDKWDRDTRICSTCVEKAEEPKRGLLAVAGRRA